MSSKKEKLSHIFQRECRRASNEGLIEEGELFLDSYPEESGAVGGDNINRVELRSGLSYPSEPSVPSSLPSYEAPLPPPVTSQPPPMMEPSRVPPPPPPPPQSQVVAPGHSAVGASTVAQTPIRVIPTHISIRQFSGSDVDYSARQFLDLCESDIVNSSITEDHDKIAFIRSRLLPGSRALLLMQSSAFASSDIGSNYEIFKKNFIKIFGGGNKPSIVRQVAHTVESLQKNASTKPIWDGMVDANQLAQDCIKSLKDANWITNGQISENNLKKFLEFSYYFFQIPDKARRASLTLNFKPGGKLVDFVSDLEIKLQEHAQITDVKASVAAPIQSASKSSLLCYTCKEAGHIAKNCKLKDSAKSSNRDSYNKKFHEYKHNTNTHKASNSSSYKKTYFCHLHGAGSHDTEKCYTIQKLKEDHKAKEGKKESKA